MISLGVDVGSLLTKVVLMGADRLLARRVVPTGGRIGEEAPGLVQDLLDEAGVAPREVDFIGATGRGAGLIQEADFVEDEVRCLAAAVSYYLPSADLALHMGGQSIAAVQVGSEGEVLSFFRNDKCAAGTGRFLEMMSARLQVSLEELDGLAGRAREPREVSSQCVVFAESEAISHINAGVSVADIVAGLFGSIGRIVASQGRRVRGARRFTLTGGVAAFQELDRVVQDRLGLEYLPFPEEPSLAAALGAALLEEE